VSQKKIVGELRDKLIIALQMEDIVGGINLAMRVRKLSFTLDYSVDHFPRLYMQLPDGPRQQIMKLDVRKHCCYISPPSDRELFFAFNDIHERLRKLGGRLSLTGDRPKQGPRRVVLQVYVEGATKIALTLMDTFKGRSKTETAFQLPDGTTP
jgi:hypothetical protein